LIIEYKIYNLFYLCYTQTYKRKKTPLLKGVFIKVSTTDISHWYEKLTNGRTTTHAITNTTAQWIV